MGLEVDAHKILKLGGESHQLFKIEIYPKVFGVVPFCLVGAGNTFAGSRGRGLVFGLA